MKLTHNEQQFHQFVMKNLDEHAIMRGLQTLSIAPALHKLFMLLIKHHFQLSLATTEFMDYSGTSPFAIPKIMRDFQQSRDKMTPRLLTFTETAPQVLGNQTVWQVQGYSYVQYESYILDDLQHLVVHAKLDQYKFGIHWHMMPKTYHCEVFEKIHVYRWEERSWVLSYDSYAEQYREAYVKMQELMS